MRKISFAVVCNLAILWCTVSCSPFNDHNTTLHISESDHYYKIYAHYNKGLTHKVDNCMDKYFGNASHMSFANTTINGDISMDNGTNFYIKKEAGYLKVEFNKEKNSNYSYDKVKGFAESLKKAIQ